MYIHQRKDWPEFQWDEGKLAGLLAEVRYLQGQLLGRMQALGFSLREEATLQILTQDVVKTSAIEGEKLGTDQVRSSIAKKLGLPNVGMFPQNHHVEGIVDVMLDATRNYDKPLTKNRLLGWHVSLFSGEISVINPITIGKWRTGKNGAMQVVSGAHGREKIHYEAPSHSRLQVEMKRFLAWFAAELDTDPVLKAALAHFWFVTIHPFDDGNGRIARAIADMQLARCEKSRQRFYSMSSQIQRERSSYYGVLEQCQKGTLDITVWMQWFLHCLKRAIHASEAMLEVVLEKARFWETYASEPFNDRQRKLINRLLDGFEGKLTSSKWAKIAKCSQDTALRDISDLINRNILVKEEAGGRSTSYSLSIVP